MSVSLSIEDRLQGLLAESLMAGHREGWTPYLKASAVVPAIALVGAAADLRLAPTNLAMLYLLGAVLISYRWGFGPALTFSLIATLTFDFFFIPPYESFAITDLWYLLTAVTLMGVALFISLLTASVRRHALAAERREAQASTLYALMQSLASAREPSEILRAAAERIRTTFGLDIAILLPAGAGGVVTQLPPAGSGVGPSLHAAAERFFAAARGGAADREAPFVPLRVGDDVIGVIVLPADGSQPPLENAERLLLEAMAGQVALAIQRADLEEKAREAEREQQRAQRAKAEAIATLAGGLAHELNNLLTGVMGNAELLADSLPAGHHGKILLDRITTSGERAARIVAQILAYAGKGRCFDELVDFPALVGRFVESLPPLPPQIEVKVKMEDRLPPIQGDRNQLLQLLGNLFLNALEAIGQGPGRIDLSVYGNCGGFADPRLSKGDCICLSVADTGTGIEESIRPRIFDPFFSTKFIGRGLGLPAAEGIMRAHNGAIQVASEPGKGSVVTCVFPVLAEKAA